MSIYYTQFLWVRNLGAVKLGESNLGSLMRLESGSWSAPQTSEGFAGAFSVSFLRIQFQAGSLTELASLC